MARKSVEAALDRQAVDILMLDIREAANFADYFVICTAESDRQLRAIRDAIEESLAGEGIKPYRREGSEDSGWVLLDFSQIIVHIFSPPERAFYNIEKLWEKAVPVVRIL
ncbi:MAG: ribosome silencing factor [Dehalococcoidia bacterium]|nr:ribosome silencing factor [Dehalococcoidia bacterium]